MLAACQRNGVKLAIGHQGRWMPRHEKVRQLIADGAIGQVLTGFAGPPKPDAGLMNIATHQMNYWQYMLGDPTPLWVLANVQRQTDRYERGWPAEDLAGLLVEFEGGIRLSMESDTPPEGLERDLRVITGTEGVIWLSGGTAGNVIRLLRHGRSGWETIEASEAEFSDARTLELDALAAWATGRN